MEIEKNLEWFPSFENQIDIKEKTFTITIKQKELEIECDWDYGYGGRGTERMYLDLELLENLIAELRRSQAVP